MNTVCFQNNYSIQEPYLVEYFFSFPYSLDIQTRKYSRPLFIYPLDGNIRDHSKHLQFCYYPLFSSNMEKYSTANVRIYVSFTERWGWNKYIKVRLTVIYGKLGFVLNGAFCSLKFYT